MKSTLIHSVGITLDSTVPFSDMLALTDFHMRRHVTLRYGYFSLFIFINILCIHTQFRTKTNKHKGQEQRENKKRGEKEKQIKIDNHCNGILIILMIKAILQ